MSLTKTIATAAALVTFSAAAYADGIMISDAYARVSRPGAPTGAAFMVLMNHTATDDRLIAASTDIAQRVELHTHIEIGDSIMQMTEIEGGIPVPAGGTHQLARGGDHVMFMGLTQTLEQGAEITVTLTFEQAGEMVVTIPVDNDRQDAHGGMDHGTMDHGIDTSD